MTEKDRDLYTVKQFCERNPAFTQSALRALIYRSYKYGLGDAIVRLGKRVYILEKRFFEIIVNQQNINGESNG